MNKIIIKKYPATRPSAPPPCVIRVDDEAAYILQRITQEQGLSIRYLTSEIIKQAYYEGIIEFMEVK